MGPWLDLNPWAGLGPERFDPCGALPEGDHFGRPPSERGPCPPGERSDPGRPLGRGLGNLEPPCGGKLLEAPPALAGRVEDCRTGRPGRCNSGRESLLRGPRAPGESSQGFRPVLGPVGRGADEPKEGLPSRGGLPPPEGLPPPLEGLPLPDGRRSCVFRGSREFPKPRETLVPPDARASRGALASKEGLASRGERVSREGRASRGGRASREGRASRGGLASRGGRASREGRAANGGRPSRDGRTPLGPRASVKGAERRGGRTSPWSRGAREGWLG